MRRVAVTGIGVISPLGSSAAELFANATAGRSAIRRINETWCKRLVSPLAACVNFSGNEHFAPAKLRMLDRVSQFAIVAARGWAGHKPLMTGIRRSMPNNRTELSRLRS